MKEMRGSAPTAECQAQWNGTLLEPHWSLWSLISRRDRDRSIGNNTQPQEYDEWLMGDSFPVALALGALGLYA